tara:strand:+ start:79 stop:414 length:336 start_codon:yes stop_codon:yes gene_type:complete
MAPLKDNIIFSTKDYAHHQTGAFPLTYLILNKPAPESTSVRQANSVSYAPVPEKTSLRCTKNVLAIKLNYRSGFDQNSYKFPPLDRKTAIPLNISRAPFQLLLCNIHRKAG